MNAKICVAAIFIVAVASADVLAETHHSSIDPAKVLGSDACAKCHDAEIGVWKKTPHFETFRKLHRKPEAKAIAERMGVKSIKRGETCIQCHYTEQGHGGATKAISGISCESCHGASQDWIKIHNDYGGPDVTRDQESAGHRKQRRDLSITRGMRNPQNLYLLAKSCYNCHTTPNEKLVNVGKHPAGSLDFELVSWSQGMVRHNFVRSHGKSNDVSNPDRLRTMFVVGVMTDLEYSLRATAMATQKATFGVTSAKRANTMKKKLIEIQSAANDPYVEKAVAAINAVKLKLNNRNELLKAADEISQAAYEFAEKTSGGSLAAIDKMMPSQSKYKN